ncbi:TonB-dependent receptor [Danxiaibacter flavus]|uniref:TonB-dependent receptor n=1 Tax=Danxiaibacter flavus TaxID=3049108 RepID=A0ABV3ZE00_9BACT|nr:TonB-dependent receptor [Chitinophagaceae bacterium DXS]
MKPLTMLIILSLFVSTAIAQNKITLQFKKTEISTILTAIEAQSKSRFLYNSNLKAVHQKIDFNIQDTSLVEILNRLLLNNGMTYKFLPDHVIVINSTGSGNDDNTKGTSVVTGKITDVAGTAVSGAAIVIKGSSTGVATDANGMFKINAANNDTLIVSTVNSAPKEIAINGQGTLSITLESAVKNLEEVVVVGYGAKKKEFLVTSVATVGQEAFRDRPITDVSSALQGAAPGLIVQRYSGQPGAAGWNVNVRGASSITSTPPLILIDGIQGNMDLLNPNDIESMSILKDASASIYGARAAGGVILITTKKGKTGKAQITYSGNVATSKVTGMMEQPNTYQFAVMDNEAYMHTPGVNAAYYTPDMLQRILNNDPNPIPDPNPDKAGAGMQFFFTTTDWYKEIFRNGFQQKHALTVSGSNDKSDYFISGNFSDQKGIMKNTSDGNKLYNLRVGYGVQLRDWLKLETKLSYDNQVRTDVGGGSWGIIGEGIFGMPNHPVYTPDGKYFAQAGWGNAVGYGKEEPTATFKTTNINTNIRLVADIIEGLKMNLQFGANNFTNTGTDMQKAFPLSNWDGTFNYWGGAWSPDWSYVEETNGHNNYYNYTGYLQYTKRLGSKHNFDVMAGGSYEKNSAKNVDFYRWNIVGANSNVWDVNLGTGDVATRTSNNFNEQWAIGSAFSRLNYAYDGKYLLEANLRYDGSSKFAGADKRWGLFPGISAGWIVSKESFFRVNFINNLKLRASYGTTGNQAGIGLYDFVQKISIGSNGIYPFGNGRRDPSASLDTMVAHQRTWETLINQNIGLDAQMLSNRLSFSFDVFQKRNKNMLIRINYPSMLGSTPPTTNAGELKTWGFETSIGWNDKIGKDFHYSVRLMLSDAQNKVVRYEGANSYVLGLNSPGSGNIREGDPLNTYYGYVFDGVIKNKTELEAYQKLGGVHPEIGIGDARFKDVNGDGQINLYSNKGDGDVVKLGTIDPRYIYGINLNAGYKGFDLGVFFQGVGKRTLFRTGEYAMPWSDWWRQPPAYYYQKTWNEDRPNAELPRLSHGDVRNWNYQASTLQKINAAYIRLKNLQIGYSLPQSLISKISLSRARVYFSGQDLWEKHQVKGGWDPESADWGGNYPFQRYYSFGLDVTF